MTRLTPNSKFEYVMVQGKEEHQRFWVHNKQFSVHINDMVVVACKESIAFVRVIRRSATKPIKGTPNWRIIATENQFPVAENEQVVACDHVAPAPNSIAMIKNAITNARIDLAKAEEMLINNGN